MLFGMRDRDWLYAAGVDELAFAGLCADNAVALVDGFVQVGAGGSRPLGARLQRQPAGDHEAIATLTEAELSGSAPINRPLAVGLALEYAFEQDLVGLPADSRRALLIAAASVTGDAREIAAALAVAGLGTAALDSAEREGVIVLAHNRVEFRHPLVRSAAYHLHPAPQRRAAHRALAEALGDDARAGAAWHWAAATAGPDEEVATRLERAAEVALARSAYAAAASAYEAAAVLSVAADDRLRRAMGAGRALWLDGEAARAAALLDDVVDLAIDPIVRADLQQLRALARLFTCPVVETQALLVAEAELVGPYDPSRAATMLATAAFVSTMAADVERAV